LQTLEEPQWATYFRLESLGRQRRQLQKLPEPQLIKEWRRCRLLQNSISHYQAHTP
jgi:hypothetical protein